MKKRSWNKRIIIFAVVILFMAVLVYTGYGYIEKMQSKAAADKVLSAMMDVVPEPADVSSEAPESDLRSMSIEGYNVVGCLEVPALDIMVPVISEDLNESGFVHYENSAYKESIPEDDNSSYKGLKICGSRNGVFEHISELKPGDKAAFIDIDGRRYDYRVVTQYHLKTWDDGGNDLMLCYRTDDITEFVVGFSRES